MGLTVKVILRKWHRGRNIRVWQGMDRGVWSSWRFSLVKAPLKGWLDLNVERERRVWLGLLWLLISFCCVLGWRNLPGNGFMFQVIAAAFWGMGERVCLYFKISVSVSVGWVRGVKDSVGFWLIPAHRRGGGLVKWIQWIQGQLITAVGWGEGCYLSIIPSACLNTLGTNTPHSDGQSLK